ncbi:MAG: hypothetical protein WCS99_18840 [Limisphaerales bacterium]
MNPSVIRRRTFIQQVAHVGAAGAAWAGWPAGSDGAVAAPADIAVTRGNRVHRTARAELELALTGQSFAGKIEIGLVNETPAAQALIQRGVIALHRTPEGQDAFEVLHHEGTLFLLGTTPRGMLHAVFALREALADGGRLADGFRLNGTFQFRQRIFHPRFNAWPGDRADVRFIAHLGATHCLVCHDWQGNRRSLQGYVTSPVFPNAVDAREVAQNHAALRRLLDDCADYGLGAMLWLTELPCQGGPWVPAEKREQFLTRFPAEVLSDSGTYEGRVLCFGHPRVQEFYRDLLQRFFAGFPEIETLFLFGLDSGGEFCDSRHCPRCRGMSPIEQRDRLIRFLITEGRRVRPGLRVLTTGWKWDRNADEFLRHQAALPAEAGVYLAAQMDGWQCERQAHDLLKATRRVCRERGQTFIGYDDFHWGDDTVHGLGDIQDFPLGIAAKIRRWHALEADGVFDHWGGFNEDLWCNSIACREFFLDPLADAGAVCRRIAHRQFGPRAGELAFNAWQALERAHRLLSNACTWSPQQWPGWYGSRGQAPLPGSFPTDGLRASKLPPRTADDGTVYNPADFTAALQAVADAWRQAFPHYEAAARLLKQAEAAAGDAPLFYRFWWNGKQAIPTQRDHLRRQRLYVESMALTGREIGLQFGLHALWEKLGHDAGAYRKQAVAQLREDVVACRDAAGFFQALGKPKGWPAQYEAKARGIEEFLKAENSR